MKLRIILLSYFYKDIYFINLMLPAKRFKKFFPALSLVLISMKYDFSYICQVIIHTL